MPSRRQVGGVTEAGRRPSAIFFAPAAHPLGGVQTWLDRVVPRLLALGIDSRVALCCADRYSLEKYKSAHPSLPSLAVVNPTGSMQGRVDAIASVIKRNRPTFALSANIADTFLGVAQARRQSPGLQTRSVMTLHAVQADFVNEVSAIGESIDAIVTTNRLARLLVENTGYPPARTFYAPYGVTADECESKHVRSSLQLGKTEPVRIAYVGRFEESQKRVSLLQSLCDALADDGVAFELWLAGGGPDEVTLRKSLTYHQALGRVRWLGNVPPDAVADRVYRKVDVLINPSFWETGPIVAWEAMANGVVLVSSRYVGSGQEAALVDDINCRLFEIGDAAGAAIAIRSVLAPDARKKLCSGAYSLVRARYSLDASVKAWAESLRSITELPLRPTATIAVPNAGRLDRWFGVERGERLRRLLGVRFKHSEPGAAWPHSYGKTGDIAKFWRDCEVMDRGADQAPWVSTACSGGVRT